jgi:hypothetical protein
MISPHSLARATFFSLFVFFVCCAKPKNFLLQQYRELLTTPPIISEELITTPPNTSEKLLVTSSICIQKRLAKVLGCSKDL